MTSHSTVVPLRQPGEIDDPLTGVLRHGATIPVSQTTTPVDSDDLLDSLDADTRAWFTSLVTELNNGTSGRGKDIRALLRNLGASFAAGRTLVPGFNLKYTPVPLAEKCTQFLTRDRGWLDTPSDLRQFPVGRQKLAGVDYLVRDFKTSPLPCAISLEGGKVKTALPPAVKGIPVGGKADALFFLHTFKQLKAWQPPKKGDATPPTIWTLGWYSVAQ